ncbi:hypothetical protein D9619_009113 [Psilocybe cf. subviscida]|uniref:Pali-domain-containing protein n=1 Tax=Psilocybe cf. subviscida TaxID=2480587 RepID=A0A8H5BV16_9AGAR|nr:hypothetical protein D9619_009113 [Psilocybe cf. subviscida]
MSRAFCIPGIVFLFCALVLSFLVSISLPFLPALDIVRVNYGGNGNGVILAGELQQIRYGIWAPCAYDKTGSRTCLKSHHGYETEVGNPLDTSKIAHVKSSWTRGLAVHPVATAAIFVAFLLSFSTHITVTLMSSIMSFLAALLTLIAFAIDIALFIMVRRANNNLDIGANTNTSAASSFLIAFWMTLVVFILLLMAGCTVCFGRRRARMADATTAYPMQKTGFFSRFRR